MDIEAYQKQLKDTLSSKVFKKFYIYEIWDPIKNEPFYVGKAHHRKRYYRCLAHFKEAIGITKQQGNNSHKRNRINNIIKQGSEPLIKIVFETDDEQEAYLKEKELIKLYGKRSSGTGTLTNMTDGGEGLSGHKATPEQRQKICERMRGTGNPMYGCKHTAEAIHAMSVARKAQKPTRHSQEWKDYLKTHCKQLSEYNIQPVYQIDFEGNILNKFPSMKKAKEVLNFKSLGNIASCCKIKHRTYMGFYWRYISDPDIKNGRLKNIKEINTRRIKHHEYSIFQINSSGETVKVWDSVLKIEKALGINRYFIYNAIAENKKVIDFYWKRIK